MQFSRHTVTSTVSGPSALTSLTIATGATLDLTNQALALDYVGASAGTLLNGIRAHLSSRRLLSSDAQAGSAYAIGYADNSVLHRTTLDDLNVDDATILLQLCLKGDANLSGNVSFEDLVALARNYNGSNKVWTDGDFNYDGSVDFADLVSLAKNYNKAMTTSEASIVGAEFASDYALAQNLVPEPSGLFVFTALGAATVRRRRRVGEVAIVTN